MSNNTGRTKKFFYNTVAMACQQVVVMLIGLITPRIMLVNYGSEINGLVSSITQFISYFNLVEAGLSGAAIYALYKPLAENDYKGINGIISASKRFYEQAGWIFTLLTVGLAVAYPLYIKSDLLSYAGVGALVLILGVNGALEFFTLSKYRVLLTADQRSYVISTTTIITELLRTGITIFLATKQVNIVILKFIVLFSVFVRSAILLVYCKKKYTYIDYKEKPNKQALNKRWDALYLQLLGSVQGGAPVVLLTLLLKDLKIVSVYSIFNMVLTGINGVLSIFTSGLSASFGDVIACKESETLKKSYKEFEFIYYLLITIVYSITLITIMPFIAIYTADIPDTDYALPWVGFLFTLNGLFNSIKVPQGMLVISAGMYKETRWRSTLQAVILLVAGAALTPFLGIYGVLLGSILSNVYRDIDLLIFVPRRIVKMDIAPGVFRVFRMFLCIGLSLLPFFFISYSPENLFSWFLYAIAVGIYVMLVVLFANVLFEKKEFMSVLKRVKGMVMK